MKTAFTYWNKRIAPVFDTAHHIKVIETESERIISAKLEVMESDLPAQKALRLSELGVSTLVCGAISKSVNEAVMACGIRVIPFVAGELQEVVEAWMKGSLEQDCFSMPGCRGCRTSAQKQTKSRGTQ